MTTDNAGNTGNGEKAHNEKTYEQSSGIETGTQYMDKAPMMWKCPECKRMNPRVEKCRYCGTARP